MNAACSRVGSILQCFSYHTQGFLRPETQVERFGRFLCKMLMPFLKKMGFSRRKLKISLGRSRDPQVSYWTQVRTALGKSLSWNKPRERWKVCVCDLNCRQTDCFRLLVLTSAVYAACWRQGSSINELISARVAPDTWVRVLPTIPATCLQPMIANDTLLKTLNEKHQGAELFVMQTTLAPPAKVLNKV